MRYRWVVEQCQERRWRPVESPCGHEGENFASTTRQEAQRELRIWEEDFPLLLHRLVKYVPEVKK